MGVAERRERERQARKGAVLEAARHLLLEKGFRGTTTKEVARRCELSEATIFFYFKNKDEILLSLLLRVSASGQTAWKGWKNPGWVQASSSTLSGNSMKR
jgi:AcrR family transcriptional regulator